MSSSYPSYGGYGPVALHVLIAEFTLTSIIIGLRLFVSLKLIQRPKLDLLWVLLAYLCGTNALIFGILCIYRGVANHAWLVDPSDLPVAILYNWIFNVSSIMSTGFGKMAVAALVLEVQGRTHQKAKWLLYLIAGSSMTTCTIASIVCWFQCSPVHTLWTAPLPENCPRMMSILYTGVVQGSWSATCDFALAMYPVWIFWNLETSLRRKLTLIALFCGGAVAGVGAIMKTVYILRLDDEEDETYSVTALLICAATEMWLIIIMSSIPALHPLVKGSIHKARGLKATSSYHRTGLSTQPFHDSARVSSPEERYRFNRSLRPDLLEHKEASDSRGSPKGGFGTIDDEGDRVPLKNVTAPTGRGIVMTRDLEVESIYRAD